MSDFYLLLLQAVLSVSMSLAVLSVISKPLVNVLCRICPDEQAAAFWLSYAKLMLIISPLLLVLTVEMFSFGRDPLTSVRLTVIAGLGGLLIGLHTIATRLRLFVIVPQQKGGAS